MVTGLGVVSCLGSDVDSYWAGLMRARQLPSPVDDPYANMANRLLYGVADTEDVMGTQPEQLDPAAFGRASSFALRAARAALRDAGLAGTTGTAAIATGIADAGISIGTGVGDESLFERAHPPDPGPVGADAFPFKVSSALAERFGLTGPMLSVSTACSASAYSVSLAAEAIRDGQADVMLTGGVDGYTRVGIACFNRMGALDPVRCRPFERDRRGTVFGEGAALLVLESESHARARGCTRWYATVDGAGWSCDGHHATAPEPAGAQIVRAARAALTDARLSATDIDCVIPHGTGTPLNDAVEARVLHEVFGERIDRLPAYSLKAMLGHTGGAAGAFALLTAALIIRRGVIPPNVVLAAADPEHRLHLHTGAALSTPVRHTMINAYAFGGNNISVVVGRA